MSIRTLEMAEALGRSQGAGSHYQLTGHDS